MDKEEVEGGAKSSVRGGVFLPDLLVEAKKNLQMLNKEGGKNGVTYGLVGSSGSGKSTIIKKIFLGEVYSNDPQKLAKYYNYKSGDGQKDPWITLLYTESMHSDALQGLDKDKVLVDTVGFTDEGYKWMHNMNMEYDKEYNFVVMCDDVIKVKFNTVIEKAFLTYRNMNISSVLSLQYLKLIPLPIRTSIYFFFLLPLNSVEAIEGVVRAYLLPFLEGNSWGDKIKDYKRKTADHAFFVIDNLNHKCYHVSNHYYATELEMIDGYGGASNMSRVSYRDSKNEESGGEPDFKKRKRGEDIQIF
jgi:hypothetical protein